MPKSEDEQDLQAVEVGEEVVVKENESAVNVVGMRVIGIDPQTGEFQFADDDANCLNETDYVAEEVADDGLLNVEIRHVLQEDLDESMDVTDETTMSDIMYTTNARRGSDSFMGKKRPRLLNSAPDRAVALCSDCGFRSSVMGVQKHIQRHHSSVSYQCDVCHSDFGIRYDMRRHRLKHFSSEGRLLNNHLRIWKENNPGKQPPVLSDLEEPYEGSQEFEVAAKRSPLMKIQSLTTVADHMVTTEQIQTLTIGNQCPVCLYKGSGSGVFKHMQKEHPLYTYQCRACDQRFGNRCECLRHEDQHVAKCEMTEDDCAVRSRNIICELCGDIMDNEDQLDFHFNTKHTDQYGTKCPHCALMFPTVSDVHDHIKKMHCDEQTRAVVAQRSKCPACDYVTDRQLSLHIHYQKDHDRQQFRCDRCAFTTLRRTMLNRHLTLVHGGIRYHCDLCGASYSEPHSLKRHKVRDHTAHGKVKTKECPHCRKSFRETRFLTVHINRMHKQEKKHWCNICNKSFFEAVRLREHKLVHMDAEEKLNCAKWYACKYCPRVFIRSQQLKQHENTHTGLRPYKCQYCDMGFAYASMLPKHRATHHPELLEQLSCTICAAKGQLRRHIQTHESQTRYKCDICQKVMLSLPEYENHLCSVFTEFSMSSLGDDGLQLLKSQGEVTLQMNSSKFKISSASATGSCVIKDLEDENETEVCFKIDEKGSLYPVLNLLNSSPDEIEPFELEDNAGVTEDSELESVDVVFLCGICQETFSSQEEVGEHMVVHGASEYNVVESGECSLQEYQDPHIKVLDDAAAPDDLETMVVVPEGESGKCQRDVTKDEVETVANVLTELSSTVVDEKLQIIS